MKDNIGIKEKIVLLEEIQQKIIYPLEEKINFSDINNMTIDEYLPKLNLYEEIVCKHKKRIFCRKEYRFFIINWISCFFDKYFFHFLIILALALLLIIGLNFIFLWSFLISSCILTILEMGNLGYQIINFNNIKNFNKDIKDFYCIYDEIISNIEDLKKYLDDNYLKVVSSEIKNNNVNRYWLKHEYPLIKDNYDLQGLSDINNYYENSYGINQGKNRILKIGKRKNNI